jgi:ubiquinone/menaquinone biosynthesis C-methylase UbiE
LKLETVPSGHLNQGEIIVSDHQGQRHHICPWYMAYTFDNPLRKLLHDSSRILGPYVRQGMTVLDLGCGMGYFSLGMARLVGESGKVFSVDMQPEMLRIVEKRARRKGLFNRIETVLTDGISLQLGVAVDFALCFWMVHEVPDQAALFGQLYSALKPGGHLFVAEPGMRHVSDDEMEMSVALAGEAGFVEVARPRVRISKAVVLRK